MSETLVISEESSTSSDVSGDGRTSDAGAGTEIVELVSLDELPKKARHESLGDIVEDDDISQLMSETGVVMVTDEKSHVTMESEGVAAGRKGKRASSAVIYSDDEETDSCVETDSGDEFKGFSVGSSREETPDRSLSQLSVCFECVCLCVGVVINFGLWIVCLCVGVVINFGLRIVCLWVGVVINFGLWIVCLCVGVVINFGLWIVCLCVGVVINLGCGLSLFVVCVGVACCTVVGFLVGLEECDSTGHAIKTAATHKGGV